jgi:hypothetical protein
LTDSGNASDGATVTFGFSATDTAGNVSATTATGTVTITPVESPAQNDGSIAVVVHGPVRAAAGDKTVSAKVTNTGSTTFTVCDTDISWDITVNGSPTTGAVAPTKAACVDLGPGSKHMFKYVWTFGAGEVNPGATASFTATVNIAGDPTPADNTATETATAK